MSPHLYRLHILFDGLANNWEEVGDFGLSEDAVDTFHACLSRDAFVGLGRDGVYIKLGLPSDAAGPWLVRLFGPWLTRGVLGIKLPGHMLESTEELPEPCLCTLITSGIFLKMIVHERRSANDRVTVKHAVAFVVNLATDMLLTVTWESTEDVVCDEGLSG
ncbi:hypothetical protein C8Q72DRAFT_890015 [Fomitopsis betulina]|nr:hypothetical protein C8Q72DRAFT_890015 [Fomitopsis betulina]